MADTDETPPEAPKFDFAAFPADTLFYDRRTGVERREAERAKQAAEDAALAAESASTTAPPQRRAKKERRRRIDPTTFEKQYTPSELEFMTAMQRFKVQTGKTFPTHAEVLQIACSLGYRKITRRLPISETVAGTCQASPSISLIEMN